MYPDVSPESWLTYAASDLALAHVGRDTDGVLPQQVCFHAQQAAEKALKSVLVFRNISFPRTHDLEVLIELAVRADVQFPAWSQEVAGLNPYAVEVRYPGYPEDISEHAVREALDLARRIVDWAQASIR